MQIQPKNQLETTNLQATSTNEKRTQLSEIKSVKTTQNIAILSAVAKNSAANNPMQLLYKTAIDELNKQLSPSLKEDAIQNIYDSDIDISPEATAKRIVDNATGFYQSFIEQSNSLNSSDTLNEFIAVIKAGIEKGFEDAKGILASLEVLEGDVKSNIDLTYNIVQENLLNFQEQLLTNSEL